MNDFARTPMLVAVLVTVAKTRRQSQWPSTGEQIRRCETYTQWNTTQP